MATVLICGLIALVSLLAGVALALTGFVAALSSPTGKTDRSTMAMFYAGLGLVALGLMFAGAGVWTVATW